jgi:alditol oxidase
VNARTNWAGNYTYGAGQLLVPRSLDEVRAAAASSPALRVLGSMHSFNDIADSEGDQLSLTGLDPEIAIDSAARTVSFTGGVRYGELARALDDQGWALANLASLPHISVAGAVATATHGSGDRNRVLSTSVVALDLVTSSGELVRLRAGDVDFAGAVVGLGALGVVTRVELAIEPTFQVAQNAFDGLSWTALEEHFDAVTSAGYSVSLFTDWSADGVRLVLVKSRVGDEGATGFEADAPLFGAVPADGPRHPLAGLPADNVTEQLGRPGPWFERLPHFRLDFTPSNGEEIQSEYLVGRSEALGAIGALRSLGAQIGPLLQTGEIRTMASDELWLSGAYERDTVAFHFTWIRDQQRVEALLPVIEQALAPYRARPHWGKVFHMSAAEIADLYPRMNDFRELATRLDPRGAFRNNYMRRNIFAE